MCPQGAPLGWAVPSLQGEGQDDAAPCKESRGHWLPWRVCPPQESRGQNLPPPHRVNCSSYRITM